MEYFAGLDVSMAETQICVMGRNGAVIHKAKVPSTPADIAAELAQLPTCRRIVFETGRMAPMLYHGLRQLGLPVICVESRQAYQALKLLATHKTDHNDARGLAHLARTGFFKPVHVKSLPDAPVAALRDAAGIVDLAWRPDHRSQEAGWSAGHSREPDPRPGRGVRRPTAACAQLHIHQAGSPGKRGYSWPVRCHAGSGCGAYRRARRHRGDRRRHKTDGQSVRCVPPADEHSRCRATHGSRIHSGS